MAPNKFEEHIKEKLNNRRLKPSADAWNTLSKRLENQSPQKSKKPYLWYGIAASIVGVFLFTTVFYKKSQTINETIEIVNNPKTIQQESNKEIANEEVINISTIQEKDTLQNFIKPSLNLNNESTVVENKETSKILQEIKVDKPVETEPKELTFEEQKIQDVVAQIQTLKDNNTEATDSEIDALLLKAQKEIKLHKLINETTGVVDAKLLLQDVEAEIDQSFRSKVFEALKEGLGTVKSAVANRNN